MKTQYGWEDFLQRFSTKVLWHFTGYNKNENSAFEILKEILKERNLRIKNVRTEIITPSGKKRFGHPCSCMCDIPFKDLRIHTARYGKYGIAFNKTSAILNGHFNPVLYIHSGHFLFRYIEERLIDPIDKLIASSKHGKELEKYLLILGTYIKRSDLTARVSIGNRVVDVLQNNNFYYEREWRSAYQWKFKNQDIEAIMIQRKDIEEINNFFFLSFG